MRKKRTRYSKSFLKGFTSAAGLAMALVLLLRITVPGAALCLQDNGGVSIEGYANGLCTYSFAVAQTPDVDNLHSFECSDKTHRLECTDIPLSGKLTEKKPHTQSAIDMQISVHALAVTIAYAAPRPPLLTSINPRLSGHHKAETKALIKSTVLVC